MDDAEPTRDGRDGRPRLVDAITAHTRLVIVSLLVCTALVGVGVVFIEYDTSLEQFETQTPETEALEYATENFAGQGGGTEGGANATATAVVVSADGEDVLTRESLLDSLALQRALYDNETVDASLTAESPIVGVENVVATSVIREDDADRLLERRDDLEERATDLDETADVLQSELETTRDVAREFDRLNASYADGEIDSETYRERAADLEAEFDAISERATADLDSEQERSFERAMTSVRSVQTAMADTERAFENGDLEEAAYDERMTRLERGLEDASVDGTVGVLGDEYDELWAERRELEAQRDELTSTELPPLDEQVAALESLNESAYERHLDSLFADEDGPIGGLATTLLPASYEPGSTTAEERLLLVRLSPTGGEGEGEGEGGAEAEDVAGTATEELVRSELAIQAIADDHGEVTGDETGTGTGTETGNGTGTGTQHEFTVFGPGTVSDEIDRAIGDSLRFVGPLALGVVLVSLAVAYRDPIEVALGVAGIVTVLLWTFGFAGWAGIAFNQLFVAVPVLLIGLSIDYAIHVFMRHRECREPSRAAVRSAMAVALAGVGVALVWVTATTAIGFLSNLVSPIAPLREFGLVTTVGIIAALLIFGGLMPAIKIELEEFLERRGIDRRKPALGVRAGPVRETLTVGARAARVAPLVVLLVVLAVTAGGLYAATSVDTNFDEEDLLAENPSWTDQVPIATHEYRAAGGYEALDERFAYRDSRVQIVVTGTVTDGDTLERIDAARTLAGELDATDAPATAGAADRDPLTVMESVAADDDSFNASFQLADRTGDGVPNQNVESLYDQLYEVDPQAASSVVARTDDGEYESVRLLVSVRGDVPTETLTAELREVASEIDGEYGDGTGTGIVDQDVRTDSRITATATGGPIVDHVVETTLLEAIFDSVVVTLVAVLAFLTIAYSVTGDGAALGAITLAPVVLAVCWIVGTMALLGIPFNVLTGTVASFTIGLGVAYNIHVSSRYVLELDRGDHESAHEALVTTMAGTGGALFGSVATTTLGFSTLALAFLPAIRQFGIVTALTIAYAFLASVLVLPTLLLVWTRYAADDA